MWRRESGFKTKFSTNETWRLLRDKSNHCGWARSVWFSQATPKFSLIAWLAMLNRLSTIDRISCWCQGVDTTCVLCKSAPETRNHLFFQCSFSSKVWKYLVQGILRNSHTNDWNTILRLMSDQSMERRSFSALDMHFRLRSMHCGGRGIR